MTEAKPQLVQILFGRCLITILVSSNSINVSRADIKIFSSIYVINDH